MRSLIVCVCFCVGVHVTGLCGGQKTTYRELILPSHHVDPEDQTQAVRLGGRQFDQMSYLAIPLHHVFKKGILDWQKLHTIADTLIIVIMGDIIMHSLSDYYIYSQPIYLLPIRRLWHGILPSLTDWKQKDGGAI